MVPPQSHEMSGLLFEEQGDFKMILQEVQDVPTSVSWSQAILAVHSYGTLGIERERMD